MASERIGSVARDRVEVNVKAPITLKPDQAGTREIVMPESLLVVQAEPVKLSDTRPIWAAKNPQRPL